MKGEAIILLKWNVSGKNSAPIKKKERKSSSNETSPLGALIITRTSGPLEISEE